MLLEELEADLGLDVEGSRAVEQDTLACLGLVDLASEAVQVTLVLVLQ